MAYNEVITSRIREALAHLPDVEEKRMFGGLTFMVDGKMCVGVSNDDLMCRIDPDLHGSEIKKHGVRSVKMNGRTYKGFVYVDQAEIESDADLAYWIDLALAYNEIAKASKKRKTSRAR